MSCVTRTIRLPDTGRDVNPAGGIVATIAIITDNDFEKVTGVTTTLKNVLRHAPDDLRVRVYTAADLAVDEPDYHAMASWGVGLPWYPQMRIYWPHVQRLRRLLAAALARPGIARGSGPDGRTPPGQRRRRRLPA